MSALLIVLWSSKCLNGRVESNKCMDFMWKNHVPIMLKSATIALIQMIKMKEKKFFVKKK